VKRRAAAIALGVALLMARAFAADTGEALPEIGPAPPFALIAQDGRPVSLADLRGRIVAVAFFFAGCSTICPLLTQKLVEVQDALGNDFGTKIRFVSITLDPEHDTQDVLKDYAAAWNAKLSGWSFLTGPSAVVREVVDRYGAYAAKTPQGSIDHTLLTSIVDQHGILRVQYLGMRFDPAEFRRDLLSLVAQE
jgi:protein SCO1/2